MSGFATIEEVALFTGRTYTTVEGSRISFLLPIVSDALRYEAKKVGKDLDQMMDDDNTYASLVKAVTIDVVVRILRQNLDSEPMTQESQSALGYSWSGTYAIPGGGINGAIMRNDLKRLGLRKQRYGSIDLWPTE
ncbi:MAG: hypothetical protein IKZ66_03585 [Schwartzia sp.]|nr:hypothetical protein [Schwartzia sp. (in: firmicutes)]